MNKECINDNQDPREQLLTLIQGDYLSYCYHAHNHGRETEAWVISKFHRYLCQTVQEFLEKESSKSFEILIINTPPQHGKSETITMTLPSWYIMRYPDKSVIEVSYGDDLAERFGKANLEKVREFSPLFGVSLDKKKATSKEFKIAGHKGTMISRGYGSPLTGYTGNLIIIDDPVKNDVEAQSKKDRDRKWSDFQRSIVSRAGAGDKIILIMTRWHEDDLAGRIIENFANVTTVINIPCECEDDEDPIGRKKGDALCPEIGKGNEWLRNFKETLLSTPEGIRTWESLYQGRPTAAEGNMIKREWWQFYEKKDYENGNLKIDQFLMSVDATFKDGRQNDYVAISVWGKTENRIYMLDMVNEHMNFMATIRMIKVLRFRYPKIGYVLIEDKANGSAIIQMMREEIFGVVPVQANDTKESRVNAVTFAIEAGNVYLPKDKNITWEFIEQCASFPNAKHDDMVDSMSQALAKLVHMRGKRFFQRAQMIDNQPFHIRKDPIKTGRGSRINVI